MKGRDQKMKRRIIALVALVLLSGAVAPVAQAQRGQGDPSGVARQAVKPEVVSLSGKVLTVETGPCPSTTGRALAGTHLWVKTQGKKLNIHLGPAEVVQDLADQMPRGTQITIEAYRTAAMPEDHYVAQTLKFEGSTIQLRDAGFRPYWAGGGAGFGAGTLRSYAGQGRGPGNRPGREGGRRWGQGPCFAGGDSSGRPGYGWRGGYGRGGGRGWGRQWRFIDQDQDGVCDNFQGASGRSANGR
jgi:hypothetical protein